VGVYNQEEDVMARIIQASAGSWRGQTDVEVIDAIRGHMWRTDHPALMATVAQEDLARLDSKWNWTNPDLREGQAR